MATLIYQFLLNQSKNRIVVNILRKKKTNNENSRASANSVKGTCSPSECPMLKIGITTNVYTKNKMIQPPYNLEGVKIFIFEIRCF
jgi:hypothetical protein